MRAAAAVAATAVAARTPARLLLVSARRSAPRFGESSIPPPPIPSGSTSASVVRTAGTSRAPSPPGVAGVARSDLAAGIRGFIVLVYVLWRFGGNGGFI